MLFIKELNPKLNTQKDSIPAKRFQWHYVQIPYCIPYSVTIVSLSHDVHLYSNQLNFFHFWLENDVKRTSKRRRFLNVCIF